MSLHNLFQTIFLWVNHDQWSYILGRGHVKASGATKSLLGIWTLMSLKWI